jgi:hypothetical protein
MLPKQVCTQGSQTRLLGRSSRPSASKSTSRTDWDMVRGYSTSPEDFAHSYLSGIGLEGHEQPYLRGGSTDVIQPGHTFSNEPGVYVEDKVRYSMHSSVVRSSHDIDPLHRSESDWRTASTSTTGGSRSTLLRGLEVPLSLLGRPRLVDRRQTQRSMVICTRLIATSGSMMIYM